MTGLGKLERLAALKVEIKTLEAQAKILSDDIMANDPPSKVVTSHGVMSLTTRDNINCLSIADYRGMVSEDDFMQTVSVSYASVKKILGTKEAETLFELGVFGVTSVATYYTLRQ